MNDTAFGLGFIGVGLLFLIVLIVIAILAHRERAAKWQNFADTHGLSFTNDSAFHLKWQYRDFFIHLSRMNKGKGTFSLHLRMLTSKSNVIGPIKAIPLVEEVDQLSLTWGKFEQATQMRNPAWYDTLKFSAVGRYFYFYYLEDSITLDEIYQLVEPKVDLLEAYLELLAFGGVTVPGLVKVIQNAPDKPIPSTPFTRQIAKFLLKDLSQETVMQFGNKGTTYCCLRCLMNVEPQSVRLSLLDNITYYGCRQCGNSRVVVQGKMKAILDNGSQVELVEQGDEIYVNWLVNRPYFDFEEVEIIQATDEEVERFAVHLGNDMDKQRQQQYREMLCTIGPNSDLSQNTMRILERTFGQVVVED